MSSNSNIDHYGIPFVSSLTAASAQNINAFFEEHVIFLSNFDNYFFIFIVIFSHNNIITSIVQTSGDTLGISI